MKFSAIIMLTTQYLYVYVYKWNVFASFNYFKNCVYVYVYIFMYKSIKLKNSKYNIAVGLDFLWAWIYIWKVWINMSIQNNILSLVFKNIACHSIIWWTLSLLNVLVEIILNNSISQKILI